MPWEWLAHHFISMMKGCKHVDGLFVHSMGTVAMTPTLSATNYSAPRMPKHAIFHRPKMHSSTMWSGQITKHASGDQHWMHLLPHQAQMAMAGNSKMTHWLSTGWTNHQHQKHSCYWFLVNAVYTSQCVGSRCSCLKNGLPCTDACECKTCANTPNIYLTESSDDDDDDTFTELDIL